MKRRRGKNRCDCRLIAALVLLTCFLTPAGANEDPESPDTRAVQEDSAFVPFVNLEHLGQAWADHDAGRLTDVALQLAAGEHVLQRSHAAITADDVFVLAINLAADLNDSETLERLAKAVKGRNTGLEEQLAAARSLAGTSRSVEAPSISVGSVSAEDFELYKLLEGEIRSARVAQDGRWVDAIDEELKQIDELPSVLQESLDQLIAASRTAIPETSQTAGSGTEFNPNSELLMALGDGSRGFGGFSSPIRISPPKNMRPRIPRPKFGTRKGFGSGRSIGKAFQKGRRKADIYIKRRTKTPKTYRRGGNRSRQYEKKRRRMEVYFNNNGVRLGDQGDGNSGGSGRDNRRRSQETRLENRIRTPNGRRYLGNIRNRYRSR